MEIIRFIICVRGLFSVLLFFIFLVLTFVFRMLKKKNKRIENITKILGAYIIALLISEVLKENFLMWEKNISTETVNFLVDTAKKDNSELLFENLVYENGNIMTDTMIAGPYDFCEEYFDIWSVDYDRKIPVELLYNEDDIKIYQSRVFYYGTNVFVPVEPFYYQSTIYIIKNNKVTEVVYSNISLLFFDMDKALEHN